MNAVPGGVLVWKDVRGVGCAGAGDEAPAAPRSPVGAAVPLSYGFSGSGVFLRHFWP